MAILLLPVGPVVEVQEVIPVTPVIDQLPVALGVMALAGPVTVAVKVMESPRFAFAAPATTATVGLALATVVV